LKLAAIDIGSNAARLLINDVIDHNNGDNPEFIKIALVRVPLRLGFDVFENGRISDQKAEKLINTIKAYQLLINVHDVIHIKACATSAMREASNAAEILQRVKEETDIDIQVITGQEEAAFIYENHIAENLNNAKSYLYIDVGGGSTELSYYDNGKLQSKESFDIGTIRLLKEKVLEETWKNLESFIKINIKSSHPVNCIGSGGNINKLFSLAKQKEGQSLNIKILHEYYNKLGKLSVAERMTLYGMREDRADVIVPALKIFIKIMQWAKAEEIFVPKIGLSDGLIHTLYSEVSSHAVQQ
jgi:exopolyphosphatase/guanosine-5'-triphosphate,3'-diphosphate pyrophosphatase